MLAQRLFYGCLNLEDVSGNNLSVTGEFEGANPRRWLGTKVCRRSMLDIYTMEQLRDAAQKAVGVRVDNGGWHFSYMGGGRDESMEERIRYKIRSAAHQELNNRRTLFEVGSKIRSRQDLFGRDSRIVVARIDDSYPQYLRDHLDEYRYLLYQEPKWYQKVWDRVSVGAVETRAKLLQKLRG